MTLLKPIGLLGGTFDPIHLGHLAVATQLVKRLDLAATELIPCHKPPHRDSQAASKHRLAMASLACQDLPKVNINPIEFNRTLPSYTVDTLTELRAQEPERPLCLIICSDAFASFNHWHRWQDILKLAHLVLVDRPGYPQPNEPWVKQLLKQHQVNDPQALHHNLAGKILIQPLHALAVSATQIRQYCAENKDISHLVPAAVAEYIDKHSLYSKVKEASA